MMLPSLIVILFAGGLLAWIAERWSKDLSRWVAVLSLLLDFLISFYLLLKQGSIMKHTDSSWLMEFQTTWIPAFGISWHFALDGLSLVMLVLTFFLGMLAVLISWREIQEKTGFFHFNLLWALAGITGVFLTMDLFLFYFFWEVMLIPMYFLIGIWGHENRRYAAYKFFIFTQASGLMMFLAILGLYFVHGRSSGTYTFDYMELLGTEFTLETGQWLMLGFLAAFVVKLPVVPFHSWLPDAHSEAPTAGSVILAGLLLKTGAYGLLRFVVPLFPDAAHAIAPFAMFLGVVGILYGAILAFSQTDFKRLVAYTSVSHMGFVMLGVFAFNELAIQGVVMQMITHGISTGALFILAGFVYERIHNRDIRQMGGFWKKMPFMGTVALIFTMASLGLPGLGNFIAEFLTLIGAWQSDHTMTILAAIGLVAATVYSLRIIQKVFHGEENTQQHHSLEDLSGREKLIVLPMVVLIIVLGLFPQPVLNAVESSVAKVTMHLKSASPPGITIEGVTGKGGEYE
jgi:NADH-quinone oxidoreductase subunit M